MELETFDIATGYNLVWGCVTAIAMSVFVGVALRSPWPRARRISWALAAMSLGPAVNKTFWALAVIIRTPEEVAGGVYYAAWSYEYKDLLVWPFAFATFGVLIAIREVLSVRLDGFYWPAVSLFIALLFVVGGLAPASFYFLID